MNIICVKYIMFQGIHDYLFGQSFVGGSKSGFTLEEKKAIAKKLKNTMKKLSRIMNI